jgi:CheY-like chemotaxis protein
VSIEPKTVLIADDEPDDVATMRRVFQKARIINPLQVVRDGREAIAYLAGEGIYADRKAYPFPILFFLDLRMPKKSGIEVLEWLQAGKLHQLLGIVVFTAGSNVTEIKEAYQLGAHSFLVKPLVIEDFMNLVSGLKGLRLTTGDEGSHLDFDTTFMQKPPSSIALGQNR